MDRPNAGPVLFAFPPLAEEVDYRYPARQSRADRAPGAFGSLRASLADQIRRMLYTLRRKVEREP